MLIIISAVIVSIVSVIILVYAFKETEPKTAAKSRPPLPNSNRPYNISRADLEKAVADQTLVPPLRRPSSNKSKSSNKSQQSPNQQTSDGGDVVTVFEPLFDIVDTSRSHSGFDSFGSSHSSSHSHTSSDHSSCDSSSSDCGSSDCGGGSCD